MRHAGSCWARSSTPEATIAAGQPFGRHATVPAPSPGTPPFPQRKCVLSAGAQCLAGRGDGAAPTHRARRPATPRAAQGRRGPRKLCLRGPAPERQIRTHQALGAVRAGQGHARDLQLHVRAGARRAVLRLHALSRRFGWRRAACRPAHQLRRRREVAAEAPARLGQAAWLAAPAPAVDGRQHLRPRLLRRFHGPLGSHARPAGVQARRRVGHAHPERVPAGGGRNDPSLLGVGAACTCRPSPARSIATTTF